MNIITFSPEFAQKSVSTFIVIAFLHIIGVARRICSEERERRPNGK